MKTYLWIGKPMCVINHLIVFLAVTLWGGYLLTPRQADAAVITVGPSDCSAATVNTAIGTAKNGDTVMLTCTGTVTWSSTVNIPSSKGVTLSVQGGTNTPKGSANFPLTVIGSSNLTALNITVGPNNAVSRVTGFKFQNSGTSDPFIKFTGYGNGTATAGNIGGFRFDNNYLDTVSGSVVFAIWSNQGSLWGVIDDNTFHNSWRASDPSYGPYNIQIWNYWHAGSGQCWGCDGWTNNDFAYGGENSVFVEDNLFEQTSTAPGHMRHYITAELGGRYVSRYNTFSNNYPDNNADLHDAHGLCFVNSNGAGSRGGEIYNNTISGTGYDRGMQLRGGSWLVYNNTITPGGAAPIEFDEYRAGSGECSATNNLGSMPPWPVPTGATWSANAPWVASVTSGSNYPLPQQIFNSYSWNNINASTGALINPGVSSALEQTYIQNNRDYFASPSKPAALSSYTPYSYPHPLRGVTSKTLQSPSLQIQSIP